MKKDKCNSFQVDLNSGFSPLRQIRAYLKISRQELADMIGVSYDTVWNWEVGRNKPKLTWDQVQALERLFDELGIKFKDIPQLGPPSKS